MKYIGQHIFDYVASFRQNVGVGIDTPTFPLHVKNSDADGDNTYSLVRIENGFGNADFGTLSGYARIRAGGTEVAALSSGASYFYNSGATSLALTGSSATFAGSVTASNLISSGYVKLGADNQILSDGSITIDIDYNNNQTDRFFKVRKDNSTDLFTINEDASAAFTGVVTVDSGTTSVAVELISSNAGSYIRFDDGADANRWYIGAKSGAFILHNNSNVGVLTLNSNASATFSSDLTVSGNLTVSGTTTTINTTNLNVEDKNITINYSTGDSTSTADGAGITIQDAVDSSTDATILWDATNDKFDFSHGILLPDSKTLQLGSSTGSGDLQLVHNGTDSFIKNHVGNLYIYNHTDDGDTIFQGDDGSGGLETYLTIDGSARTVNFGRHAFFPDGFEARFGDAYDLTMKHNGTNSSIINNVGDLQIINNTNDGDIIFKSDDGIGGTTIYFRVDGSIAHTSFLKPTLHNDNVRASFGDAPDMHIYHDSTNSYIQNETGQLYILNKADDKDIEFQCDDGSGGLATYFRLDGGLAGGDGSGTYFTIFPDNSRIGLGNNADLRMFHNGSDSFIQNILGDLILQNSADDSDIIFKTDDGSGSVTTYMYLDGSITETRFSKATRHSDSIIAKFGDGNDMNIYSDGTNGVISVETDNADLVFRGDNGSGGTDQYFRVDGGEEKVIFNKPVKFDYDVLTETNAEVNLDAISTTGSGTVVKGGFLNPATEAQAVHQPQIVNDLAGFFKWGTIVTSGLFNTRSGSSGSFSYSNEWQANNANWNRAFDSTSSHPGSFFSNNGADGSSVTPGVIELQWPTEITYSLNVGIVFGSDSFTPTNVKIEAYKGDGAGGFAWQTLCDLTGNTENVILRKVDGNSGGGSATKRLKFTLGGSNTSLGYFRIHTIYMANYQAGNNNISGLPTLDFTKGIHSLQKYDLNYVWGGFFPAQDDTYDLGSSSYEWKDGYFDGTVYADALNVDGNGEADRMTLNQDFPQLFLIDNPSGGGNSRTLQVGMSGTSAFLKKSDDTGTLIIRNSSNTNIALFNFATLNTTFGGSIIASGTVTAGGHVVGTTKAVVLVHGAGGVVGNSGSNSSDSHTWTITHGMGSSRDYKVEIIQNSGNYDTVHADITRPSDTTIVVTFSAAVANSAYKALILKCG